MNATLNLGDLVADPDAHRRLCSLMRLLATDVPGEQAAAAAGIARLARTSALDLGLVIPLRQTVEQHVAQERAAAAASARIETASRIARRGAPTHRPGRACDQADMIIAAAGDFLTPREREFLDSMAAWRGLPSERQAAWLNALWTRFCSSEGGAR
jgi:hypothetical protein